MEAPCKVPAIVRADRALPVEPEEEVEEEEEGIIPLYRSFRGRFSFLRYTIGITSLPRGRQAAPLSTAAQPYLAGTGSRTQHDTVFVVVAAAAAAPPLCTHP